MIARSTLQVDECHSEEVTRYAESGMMCDAAFPQQLQDPTPTCVKKGGSVEGEECWKDEVDVLVDEVCFDG